MPRNTELPIDGPLPPWLTDRGIDLSVYPLDGVLRQALASNDQEFRGACSILKSMCGLGRKEAGVFLLGLVNVFPSDFSRLTTIADALESFPCRETIQVFASELRRVQGSSATRAYLRRILAAFEHFPIQLVQQELCELATDPLVGARFRQHIRGIIERSEYG